jgi:hypothetical protein
MLRILILLLISLNVQAKGGHKMLRPSSILDDDYKVTLTLESDTYNATEYLSPSVTLSTKNGWDIGFSSQNVTVWGGGAQNYENDTYFNLSKTFKIANRLYTTFGTQTGYVVSPFLNQVHAFDYWDNTYKPFNWINFHFGTYYANKNLSTTTEQIGYLTGFEVIFIPHVLKFNSDYFSGHTNVSGNVSTVTWYTPIKHFSLFSGVGVPEKNSGNEFYGIVGFNLVNIF